MTDNNPNGKSASAGQMIVEILASGAELTDAEIVSRIPNMHRGQIIPARGSLAKKGLVELVGKNEAGRLVWRLTPPDRREAAQRAAQARQATEEQKIAKLRPERQAQVIAALLANPAVNRVLRDQNERVAQNRRAKARAQEAHIETEAEKRERKRELREAERKRSAGWEFLQVRDVLRDSVNALLGIHTLLNDELERLELGEPMKISGERWGSAAVNVREVIDASNMIWHQMGDAMGHPPEHCPLCNSRIARDPHALEEGYIEIAAEDITDAEVIADDGIQ